MWWWCPVCERCFHLSQQRVGAEGVLLCAYPDCPGLRATTWHWSRLHHRNPALPHIPRPTVRYPHPNEAT